MPYLVQLNVLMKCLKWRLDIQRDFLKQALISAMGKIQTHPLILFIKEPILMN